MIGIRDRELGPPPLIHCKVPDCKQKTDTSALYSQMRACGKCLTHQAKNKSRILALAFALDGITPGLLSIGFLSLPPLNEVTGRRDNFQHLGYMFLAGAICPTGGGHVMAPRPGVQVIELEPAAERIQELKPKTQIVPRATSLVSIANTGSACAVLNCILISKRTYPLEGQNAIRIICPAG